MHAFASRCFPKTIDIPADLQDRPLGGCKTSLRLADVLRRAGVRVLGDLDGRKVGDFASERNCGFETLHELDCLAFRLQSSAENASSAGNGNRCSRRAMVASRASRTETATEDGTRFAIPESVSSLQLEELPITQRLANVARSIGLWTLGDLKGRSVLELLQCKQCGWRTIAEIQQLIERAISGEFDHSHIDSIVVAELLTLLEQGIAKLPPQEKAFLLARMEGLTFAEIGRCCGFTRARVHQVVISALENLRKSYGPRIPQLLGMLKQRYLSILNSESFREQAESGLIPTSLEQWLQTKPNEGWSHAPARRFRLSGEAQLRLIAALDKRPVVKKTANSVSPPAPRPKSQ